MYISSHVQSRKRQIESEVDSSLDNCGSSVWNLLHVTLLVLRIWMHLLDFWKICSFLVHNLGFVYFVALEVARLL